MMNSDNKSYIEKIREKVATAIVIKKNALKKNIDYTTAKIMYDYGLDDVDLGTAKELAEEMKRKNIPRRLINITNLIIHRRVYGEIDEYAMCTKIATYINRKHIDELSSYCFSEYQYGKAILDMMRKGVPLEVAVDMFELKVKYEMATSHLTEIEALAKILWYNNNIAAKLFVSEYQNGRAVVDKPYATVINGINHNSEYKIKEIKGIKIVSQTESGLQKLERLIQEVIEKGNKKFVDVLLAETTKVPLMVCDFNLGKTKTSHYKMAYHCISIDKGDMGKGEEITNRLRLTFYHEVTHYLDNVKTIDEKHDYYSNANPIVGKIFEKIKSRVNPLKRGIDLSYFMNKNAKKYVNNPVLNQKWEQEIREKCPNISDKDFKLLMRHKRLEERKLFEEIMGYLIDIYDAMVKGKLCTTYLTTGHGKKYYSNYGDALLEFFANIGLLYDSGKIDVLYYEFGEELAGELIAMCNNFFNYSGKETSSNKKM